MSSSSSSIGIALLGAGIFAKEAHLPALAELASDGPSFHLVAVYSRSQKSADGLAKDAKDALHLSSGPAVYYDVAAEGGAAPAETALAALLARDDVKAVIILLPITVQPDVVRAALKAGKHVLSEKPVAPDVAAGATLIAEYRATYMPKGLIWRVAENFEAEPAFRAAGKAIADGAIGSVNSFAVDILGYVDESSKYWKTPWRTVPDYQGGFLLDGGVHFAAALRTMLSAPLATLSGHASLTKKILAPHDTITATISTGPGAAHGTFRVSFGGAHPSAGSALAPIPYLVAGTAGWLRVVGAGGGKWTLKLASVKPPAEGKEGPGELEEREETFEGVGVREEIRSWLAVAGGHDDGLGLGDPRNALKDVAVIQAALRSNGQEVDLVKLAASGEV